MLEALDRVTWADYRHAYGPAVDVPDLLRALAAGDEGARDRAKYALYGALWHEGAVYEASARAASFLIELLAPGANADKAFVLHYLADLASGPSFLDVRQGAGEAGRDGPASRPAAAAAELGWAREAHGAARRGVPMYLAMARGHADADVRAAAFRLLSRFPQDAAELAAPALDASRADGDEVVRASALFAFDWLAGERRRVEAACDAVLRGDRSPFARWAAAWVWAAGARAATPPPVAEVLATALAEPGRFEAPLARLGWFDAEPLAVTARAFGALGPLYARPYVPRLAEALARAGACDAPALVGALLGLAFGGPWEGGAPAALTPPQREALGAIGRADAAWASGAAVPEVLRAYALPGGRGPLRALAGGGAQ
jgi:hypothetical protein